MTAPRALLVGALAASVAVAARPTHAELRETAARVAEQWRGAGAEVLRLPPRFVNDDETIAIGVPPGAQAECTTVVLVAARGLSFHASIEAAEGEDEGSRVPSVAGVLSIGRCGQGPIRRVVLTSDAGRGAVEVVIGRSRAPLSPLRTILPERTGGAVGLSPEPGDLPPQVVPEKRADAAEGRARREGAKLAPRETWTAGADGTGAGHVTLDPGCHKVELFAVDPRAGRTAVRRGRLDLDAEIRDEDDHVLARDRSDAPDGHLQTCVGESTPANVGFVGSPANAPVLVTHATWGIPNEIPSVWGPDVRARMAAALLARHISPPHDPPVALAQGGGAGVTPVPVTMEPGGCYVAIVSAVQGTSKGIGLRAVVGARDAADDRGVSDAAAAVAFCAEAAGRARVDVESRGTLSWGLAVFRVRSSVWEVSR